MMDLGKLPTTAQVVSCLELPNITSPLYEIASSPAPFPSPTSSAEANSQLACNQLSWYLKSSHGRPILLLPHNLLAQVSSVAHLNNAGAAFVLTSVDSGKLVQIGQLPPISQTTGSLRTILV